MSSFPRRPKSKQSAQIGKACPSPNKDIPSLKDICSLSRRGEGREAALADLGLGRYKSAGEQLEATGDNNVLSMT